MLTKRNASGYALLALVCERLSDADWLNLDIEPYLNGRECGFGICFWDYGKRHARKLVFSECRNSDQFVVYRGGVHDFGMNNELTDEIYQNKRFFDHDEPHLAADYIVEQLNEERK